MVDAVRKPDDPRVAVAEVADVGGRAALVVDDAHLVAFRAESSIVRTKLCPVQPNSQDVRTIQPARPPPPRRASFVRP